MKDKENVCAVVLAAGKGTRMKSDLPKVATLLENKPLVVHVVETLKSLNINRIIIVVGFKKEVVMDILKGFEGVEFVEQKEQLGTGHALLCAEPILDSFHGKVLVCCGDVPLISANSFESLLQEHSAHQYSVTVLSAQFENPKGYGRLIRNSTHQLERIVEEKDASEEEKKVTEINTGTYVFESPSVFSNLKTIGTNNAQNEYYLPDLVTIYNKNGYKTGAFVLSNALESTGINSQEDLAYVHSLIKEGKVKI